VDYFAEARDSEWQWHQLGHMQICTLLQTGNHASTPPLSTRAESKLIQGTVRRLAEVERRSVDGAYGAYWMRS